MDGRWLPRKESDDYGEHEEESVDIPIAAIKRQSKDAVLVQLFDGKSVRFTLSQVIYADVKEGYIYVSPWIAEEKGLTGSDK